MRCFLGLLLADLVILLLPLHAKVNISPENDEMIILFDDDPRRLYDGYGTDEAYSAGKASGGKTEECNHGVGSTDHF